ncbi:Uncharacterised protein [Enterobacter cloacae]|nr:Uncharacterised protein [Enterobacter cloacae]
MKPFGQFFSREGCTCSLCRSRGYRKSNAYDAVIRTSKHKARQQAKKHIQCELKIFSEG